MKKKRKLLTEIISPEESNIVLEAVYTSGDQKIWKLKGQFGKVNEATANNRIYDKVVIEREIQRLGEDIKNRQLFGELDHPSDGKTMLNRVSHMITDLYLDGNKIMGEAVILDTSAGQNLKAILEGGGRVGISSRGWGDTVIENGRERVCKDFQLVTFDVVANPSVREAVPPLIIEEIIDNNDNNDNNLGGMMDTINTVADLEKAYPGLVDQIRKEAQGYFDSRLNELEGVITELKDKIQQLISSKEQVENSLKAYKDVAKMLGYRLMLAEKYTNKSKYEKILSLVGNLSQFSSYSEIENRLQKVLPMINESDVDSGGNDSKDLDDIKQRVSDLVISLNNEKDAKTALEKKIEYLNALNKHLLDLVKEVALKYYIERKIAGRSNAQELRESLERCRTKEEVDKVLNGNVNMRLRQEEFFMPKGRRIAEEVISKKGRETKDGKMVKEEQSSGFTALPGVEVDSEALIRLSKIK